MEHICPALKRRFAAMELSQFGTSTWVVLFVGVTTLLIAVVCYGYKRKQLANLPPGPPHWPIIGALLEMEPTLPLVLNKFARKYGPVVFFRLGVQDLVVVSSAEAAQEILKEKDAHSCHRQIPMARSLTKYMMFGGAVFSIANYDTEYRLHRKISTTEFFTIAKLKTYEKLRTQETAVMIEKIFRFIQRPKDNGDQDHSKGPAPMRIRSIVLGQMLNIIFSLTLGKRFDSLPPTDPLREFPAMLDELLEIFMLPNLADFFPWLTWFDPQGLLKRMKSFGKRQTEFYEKILQTNREELRSKRKSGTLDDDKESFANFVHVLLRTQEEGTRITDDGINATVLSMLSAGTDTTTYQIEFVLLELARHPKLLRRLQHEIDAVVGKERPVEEADVHAMPFLNAVILETLRMYGVVPNTFPHVTMGPSTICGYNIPPKTAVIVNTHIISRDPKVWKDPNEFNPDRFMDEGESSPALKLANGNNFHLLPFGSGRRMCPGYNLAVVLLLRIVGSLVHAFDWSPPPGCAPEDLSTEREGGFVINPSPAVYLVPTPRVSSHLYKSNVIDSMN